MAPYNKPRIIFPVLVVLFILTALLSAGFGAVSISASEIFSSLSKLFSDTEMTLNERIFTEIRFPRTLLCLFVGGSLAIGGTLLQALFRNPIVEPGLIGTSSGAAFGASLYFVLGATFNYTAGEWTLPLAACLGAILSTGFVFLFSRSAQAGTNSVVTLLLTGIAVNALFLSAVGFLSYIARDPQARSITFWNLGTLSGANWHSVGIVGTSFLICALVAQHFAKQLNTLMIGEDEAAYLGVNIKRLKTNVLILNIIMVAVATAFVGVISFVGLVVPHLLRSIGGSDNRFLIKNSAVLGGILLCAADLLSRLALAPAELPIGIVTSLVGVPVFIILLRTSRHY